MGLENYNVDEDYYKKKRSTLLEKYTADQKELEQGKRQSQQNASITLDKAKKYLPTYLKSQGLAGLGVSEGSLLQLYNNYDNSMAGIERDYQSRKNSLRQNYEQEEAKINDEEYGEVRENQANMFNEAAVNITDLMTQYTATEDQKMSPEEYEKLVSLANSYEGKVSDGELQSLRAQVEGYNTRVRDPEAQKALDWQTKQSTPTIVDGVKYSPLLEDIKEIEVDGKEYVVYRKKANKSISTLLSNKIGSALGRIPKKSDTIVYNGKLYGYSGTKWYEITGTESRGSKEAVSNLINSTYGK